MTPLKNFVFRKLSAATIGLLVVVELVSAQPSEVLSAQKLSKLIPQRLDSYRLRGVSKSSEMKVGTLNYSLCERNFANGAKLVRILLFDYVDAPIMYQQAMRNHSNMKPVESDSLVFRQIDLLQATGWESLSVPVHESKLILGVNDRFFLTITGENIDLPELKNIFRQIGIERFPK